ncbi:LytTR family transcriptional regulator DNA-binding domain-containing protein [Thermosediminibacter litoriperuensis]|uniref:LytTR family transcriptional regulator DNA-binding domain-containing protein n=1 Tax=Thermosediminibacter litoriperuensis TaxID=291989 RepID=UPI0011E83406
MCRQEKIEIFTPKGEKYKYKGPLKYFEKRLSKDKFLRTHKSYLVNLDYVKKISSYYNE